MFYSELNAVNKHKNDSAKYTTFINPDLYAFSSNSDTLLSVFMASYDFAESELSNLSFYSSRSS